MHNKSFLPISLDKHTIHHRLDRPVTAALVIIGNEILGGRTRDGHMAFLGRECASYGIIFRECAIVPDQKAMIVEKLQLFSQKYDYVFTTGGIGPTHDDITAEAVADYAGVRLIRHDGAVKALMNYYKDPDRLNPQVLKMADIPDGAHLIKNSVSGAPGFYIHNVITLAGVPKIMEAMARWVLPRLMHGLVIHSQSITIKTRESMIAPTLLALEQCDATLEIGSYPKMLDTGPEITIIARHDNPQLLQEIIQKIRDYCHAQMIEVKE